MPNGVNRLSSELHALCAAAAGSVTACKKHILGARVVPSCIILYLRAPIKKVAAA
jgi:hypothetical protein